MELQDQIYIISGVCAGVFLLLFVLVGYLMYRLASITELLMGGRPAEKRDTYAYNNPTIIQGEELNVRGFVMSPPVRGNASNPMSSLANERATVELPRIESNFDGGMAPRRLASPQDFSDILANNEVIFGGDRRTSQLNVRTRPPTHDNFPAAHRDSASPKNNYLNERMQY